MVAKRKIIKIAKVMFKNSLRNGLLDTSKIRIIVAKITKLKPEGFLQILKVYQKLVAQQVAKEEVVVESATPLAKNQEKEIIKRTKAQNIRYKLNRDMVFGAKITHGDWIYDASLDAKLEQLTSDV
ncbi:hypothetical protein A3A60_01130 [Candidatus Curtissbacteria bacterium RIFCSPLOWO2_01_FULL_42_26]|uniref:Uncharacterized protein n=1 Tax=Candidatus Curtissbacteria bacterium RIFCSPLOWO2_01_FULL_42_26 TaxID=1797729 RepID=A0A1F5HYF9_9BACT|nr:MAG: hypothetical protein A3A60_01130 [Candidatus Curtissbacteria bacterium RIFCSPLOWO2_01_FULL_42_26]